MDTTPVTEHGVHIEGHQSVRFESQGPSPTNVMKWLRNNLPSELGGLPIQQVQDLLLVGGVMAAADALILEADQCRAIVRPSSSEAELEIYGECWRKPAATAETRAADWADAHQQLLKTLDALTALVCDPERAEAHRQMEAIGRNADDDMGARAADLFTMAPASLSRPEALRLAVSSIDLTTLMGDDTDGRIRALCAQARRPDPTDATVGPTAAVCVYPNLVALAVELTEGSGVAVASVAGAFPSGLSSLQVRLADIADVMAAGADEIDVVINRAAFLAGDHERVTDELSAMRTQIDGRIMKVILETGELGSPPAIRAAANLAIDAGADWIKTSTGKSATGATPVAIFAMAQAIAGNSRGRDRGVGLKVSGGVRTSADALGYLAIIEAVLGPDWLDPSRVRFGASGLLTALVADLGSLRC